MRILSNKKGLPHTMKHSALLCVNLINDFMHSNGKFADRGYIDFAEKHANVQRIHRIQQHFRDQGGLVIHCRFGYSENYFELPKNSPLLGPVEGLGALKMHTWNTEYIDTLGPVEGEPSFYMHRTSPFYRTRLDLILRTQGIENLYIVGLPTNICVETAAREAHDRDFNVTVIEDGCIARNDEMHLVSMKTMEDIASLKGESDAMLKLAVRDA